MKKISYRKLSDKIGEAICTAMDMPGPKSKNYVVEAANRTIRENGWTPEEYKKYYRERIAKPRGEPSGRLNWRRVEVFCGFVVIP